MTVESSLDNNLKPCACGCGELINRYDSQNRPRKFVCGHQRKYKREKIPCKCGCGILIDNFDKHGRKKKFVNGHTFIGRSGPKAPYWKGGRILKSEYIIVYNPSHKFTDSRGYVPEHRLVYEQYHNCCLLPETIIHHKNGIKTDNRIENLEAMFRSDHTHHHMKGNPACRVGRPKVDMSNRSCNICNRDYTSKNRMGVENWFVNPINLEKWICFICYKRLLRLKKKINMLL